MTADFHDEFKKEKEITDISMQQSIKNKKERLKKECADANVSYVSQGGYAVPVRQTKKKSTCGCGRSPIPLCIGWHSLSESEYKQKLHEWNEHHNKKEQ